MSCVIAEAFEASRRLLLIYGYREWFGTFKIMTGDSDSVTCRAWRTPRDVSY
ncbi:hypothetical protein BDR05DRAFT_957935 [Suillus weaverae]|nr:hypothetical protein BDR05DRAFT_957935 [Suillus weaverae]